MKREKIDQAVNELSESKSGMTPDSKKKVADLIEQIFEYKKSYPIVEMYVSRKIGKVSDKGYSLMLRTYTEIGKVVLYSSSVLPNWEEVLSVVNDVMTNMGQMPTESEHTSAMNDVIESGFMFF